MGKIQKTDRAAKTVESWWALLVGEGGLGHSIMRWGWPVIGGTVGAIVASATSWISAFGVAGWVGAAIAGALLFLLIGIGIETYRLQRIKRMMLADGVKADDGILQVAHQSIEVDYDAIEVKLEELLAARIGLKNDHPTQIYAQQVEQSYKDAVIATGALAFLPSWLDEVLTNIADIDRQWKELECFIRSDGEKACDPMELHRREIKLWVPYQAVSGISASTRLDYFEQELKPDEVPYPFRGNIESDALYERYRSLAVTFTKRRKLMERVRDALQRALDGALAAQTAPAYQGNQWMTLIRKPN